MDDFHIGEQEDLHRSVEKPTHYRTRLKVRNRSNTQPFCLEVEDRQEIPGASLNGAFDPETAFAS